MVVCVTDVVGLQFWVRDLDYAGHVVVCVTYVVGLQFWVRDLDYSFELEDWIRQGRWACV